MTSNNFFKAELTTEAEAKREDKDGVQMARLANRDFVQAALAICVTVSNPFMFCDFLKQEQNMCSASMHSAQHAAYVCFHCFLGSVSTCFRWW